MPPKKQSALSRYLLCIAVHRTILIILHLGLLIGGAWIFLLGFEVEKKLLHIESMIGKVPDPPVMLKAIGIAFMAVVAILGFPALCSGKIMLLKLHMIALVIVSLFMALVLCCLYRGAESSSINAANQKYRDAFKKAENHDVKGLATVQEIEKKLQCCGAEGPSDYKHGVLDSCCSGRPPCEPSKIFQTGCTKALDKRLDAILKQLVTRISIVIVLALLIVLYCGFFNVLLRRRERRRRERRLAAKGDVEKQPK